MAAQVHSINAMRQPYAPTPGERIDNIQRGLPEVGDMLAALRRNPNRAAAEGLARQLSGLHGEAQKLVHSLAEVPTDES